jgi:hypothetical protein
MEESASTMLENPTIIEGYSQQIGRRIAVRRRLVIHFFEALARGDRPAEK